MFRQRKNKKFSYQPRYQGDEAKFVKSDLEQKWTEIKGNTSKRGSKLFSLPVLILALIALFVFMYVLDGYIK